MNPKRAVIRLQLETSAKRALDELCELRGMTQIAVISRLVRWFVAQDEIIQASVLDLLSRESLGDLASVLLSRLAGEAAETVQPTQSANFPGIVICCDRESSVAGDKSRLQSWDVVSGSTSRSSPYRGDGGVEH